MDRKGNETNSANNPDQTIQSVSSPVPNPSPRVSLPIRGANPNLPTLGRELADISVDNLVIKESDLNSTTNELLVNVNQELQGVDKSLIYIYIYRKGQTNY